MLITNFNTSCNAKKINVRGNKNLRSFLRDASVLKINVQSINTDTDQNKTIKIKLIRPTEK